MSSTDTGVAVIGGGVVGRAVLHALARRGVEEAARLLPEARTVAPTVGPAGRSRRRERWRAFVQASARL
ncbi:MAG: hypothetical protein ACHQAV_01090 [Solirubrobacterales bacterium]